MCITRANRTQVISVSYGSRWWKSWWKESFPTWLCPKPHYSQREKPATATVMLFIFHESPVMVSFKKSVKCWCFKTIEKLTHMQHDPPYLHLSLFIWSCLRLVMMNILKWSTGKGHTPKHFTPQKQQMNCKLQQINTDSWNVDVNNKKLISNIKVNKNKNLGNMKSIYSDITVWTRVKTALSN